MEFECYDCYFLYSLFCDYGFLCFNVYRFSDNFIKCSNELMLPLYIRYYCCCFRDFIYQIIFIFIGYLIVLSKVTENIFIIKYFVFFNFIFDSRCYFSNLI